MPKYLVLILENNDIDILIKDSLIEVNKFLISNKLDKINSKILEYNCTDKKKHIYIKLLNEDNKEELINKLK